jgi:hypothetical protein
LWNDGDDSMGVQKEVEKNRRKAMEKGLEKAEQEKYTKLKNVESAKLSPKAKSTRRQLPWPLFIPNHEHEHVFTAMDMS